MCTSVTVSVGACACVKVRVSCGCECAEWNCIIINETLGCGGSSGLGS